MSAQPTTTTAELAAVVVAAREHLALQGLSSDPEGRYADDEAAICLLEALACGVQDISGGFYACSYGDTYPTLAHYEQPDATDRRAQALLSAARCAVSGTIGPAVDDIGLHVWSDRQQGDTAAVLAVLDATAARLERVAA